MPVKQLKHNPAKVQPVTPALQALLSKDGELKVGPPPGPPCWEKGASTC